MNMHLDPTDSESDNAVPTTDRRTWSTQAFGNMERRGPSHSGPYGLACTSCFKSKCKCVARPNGDGCERCHRLNKQCRPSDSVRRRAIEKKQNSGARIAELESKLDNLISRLESRNVIEGDASRDRSTSGPPAPVAPSAATASSRRMDAAESEDHDIIHVEADDATESAQWSPSPRAASLSEQPDPSTSEAEAKTLFGIFRSHMLPHLAFVHISDDTTAAHLRYDRPFLFRAIMCVATRSTSDKVAQSKGLKASIYEAMLGIGGRPDMDKMDLLLGLLTYIAWGWDHVLNRCSLSRLMMQAMSVACEMGLDKPLHHDAQMMALFTPGFDTWPENSGTMTTQGFLERQRAVLGCFVLSSAVAAYFGEVDALRWTPQMENGLAAISTSKECPTDVAFAMQVRLQLFAQKAILIHQQQQMEHGLAPTDATGLPALVSLTSLQGQLQEPQASLARGLAQHRSIEAHIHSANLTISENTHAVYSLVPLMVSQFSRMAAGGSAMTAGGVASGLSAGHERSQCLWQCVRAVQACTSALLALPPSQFRGISFLQWAQLARCVVVLNQLTNTIEEPHWDRAAAREAVDVPALLDRVARMLEFVAREVGEQEADDLFTQLARTIREFRSDTTGTKAREHRAAEEVNTAWTHSRMYAGVGSGITGSIMPLGGENVENTRR